MHCIPDNLKFIRKQKGWTQQEFARQLGVKRSLIGAYEEGRADPRISFLMMVSQKFGYSVDQLVSSPLDENVNPAERVKGSDLRILPVPIDKEENTERIALVPIKAAAGYLNGFGDVEFIESLPMFDLPFPEISKGKTYRAFQTSGDSMLPIPSGTYVIASYLIDWNQIKNDSLYVIVSKSEGVVFKRVLNDLTNGRLTLKSDNPSYDSFTIGVDDISEVWKAEGVTLFEIEALKESGQMPIWEELQEIKSRIDGLGRPDN